jgi:hypothetical protein
MVYKCLSVAARHYQATKTGASDFDSSCRKIMGCTIPNIVQICQRLSGFSRVRNSAKSDY